MKAKEGDIMKKESRSSLNIFRIGFFVIFLILVCLGIIFNFKDEMLAWTTFAFFHLLIHFHCDIVFPYRLYYAPLFTFTLQVIYIVSSIFSYKNWSCYEQTCTLFFGQMSIATYLVELPRYSVCIHQILPNCTEKLKVLHIHVNT